MVYVLPRSFQYSAREVPDNWEAPFYEVLGPHSLEPFRFFDELKRRVDYPIHALLDAFRETDVFPTCFDRDPYWNEAGQRVCAEAIFPTLREVVRRIQ